MLAESRCGRCGADLALPFKVSSVLSELKLSFGLNILGTEWLLVKFAG